MMRVYVGRQPIYDRDLSVVAYELLFRGDEHDDQARFSDPDEASARVMLNTFLEIGLDKIVGDHRAYINLPRSFIVGPFPVPLPQDRVVLEILEDIEVDDTLVEALGRLAAAGYRIALDDFDGRPELEPLLALAHIVKLDVQATPPDLLATRYARLRAMGVELVAEKVETRDDFDRCRAMGFDYFQGYYLCRPTVVSGARGGGPGDTLPGLGKARLP